MCDKWIDKILKDDEESKILEMWCENIGYDRYKKIYEEVSKMLDEVYIEYEIIKSIAKYDFCLSDFLYSMLKFIELRFRAFLINHCGNVELTKKHYLYEISDVLSNGENKLDCSTYYDKKLKEKTTFADFLSASSMETLVRLISIVPDCQLTIFNQNVCALKSELKEIKDVRNYVAHGEMLLFNEKFKLKHIIIKALKYMPTKESKNKRVVEIENLNKRQLDNVRNISEKLYNSIAIIFSEEDKVEIGI